MAVGAVPMQGIPILKGCFVHCANFVIPTPEVAICVTDASQIAIKGVLMQDHGEGLKPLAFLSRQLKPTE